MNGPRAALYARVSTSGQSPELQLDELRQVARQRGWTVVGEYVDPGVSGAKEDRPALGALLGAARRGEADVLAVWKLDRLGRSLRHILHLLDELGRLGVQFVSVRDPGIDTTSPQGRLLLSVVGAFAEFERALILERVRAGVARARLSGKQLGRPRRQLDLRAANALLNQGRSVRAVADMLGVPRSTLTRRLNEQSERSRRGPEVSPAIGAPEGAEDGPQNRSIARPETGVFGPRSPAPTRDLDATHGGSAGG